MSWVNGVDLSELTEEWWLGMAPGIDTKLPITCTICLWRSTSATIHHLQKGHEPPCICNKHASMWGTDEGWASFIQLFHQRVDLHRYDVSEMTLLWWKKHIKNSSSTIIAICRDCKSENCISGDCKFKNYAFGNC